MMDGMWPAADDCAVARPGTAIWPPTCSPSPAVPVQKSIWGWLLAHDRARDWKARKRRGAGGPRRRMCPSRHHAGRPLASLAVITAPRSPGISSSSAAHSAVPTVARQCMRSCVRACGCRLPVSTSFRSPGSAPSRVHGWPGHDIVLCGPPTAPNVTNRAPAIHGTPLYQCTDRTRDFFSRIHPHMYIIFHRRRG